MIRLNLIVEGQTEETFVNEVLRNHLGNYNIVCTARCVYTSKRGAHWRRGGATKYERIRKDIQNWINQEKNATGVYFSTMFDLYALPLDFPNFESANNSPDPYKRVGELENAFSDSVCSHRFIPYIQLHEFEALLFADIQVLNESFPGREKQVEQLVKLADSFESPELIDDGPQTAPSKRIIATIPDYEGSKVRVGPISTAKIGMSVLREKCPHFSKWIAQLEQLRRPGTQA